MQGVGHHTSVRERCNWLGLGMSPQMAFLQAEGMPAKASRGHSLSLSVLVLLLLSKLWLVHPSS